MAKRSRLSSLIDRESPAGRLGGVAVDLGIVQGTGKRSDQIGRSYYNPAKNRIYNVYDGQTVSYRAKPDTVNAKFRGALKQRAGDDSMIRRFLELGSQGAVVNADGSLTPQGPRDTVPPVVKRQSRQPTTGR